MNEFNEQLLDKLTEIYNRYISITDMLSFEEVLVDSRLTIRLQKEKKKLEDTALTFQQYKKLVSDIEFIENNDEFDMSDLEIKRELKNLENKINNIVSKLNELYFNLEKETETIIIEISSLQKSEFVNVLYKAYYNVSQNLGLMIDNNTSKEKTGVRYLCLSGDNVYNLFFQENGIHEFIKNKNIERLNVCVYRKPVTRIPTFNDNDIKIEVYRSSGAGGQNINKVSTAIRMTHIPTGIMVTCQDERSQFQNREKAFENLKIKVNENFKSKTEKEMKVAKTTTQKFKSKKVRTYNIDTNIIFDEMLDKGFAFDKFTLGQTKDLFYDLAIRGNS